MSSQPSTASLGKTLGALYVGATIAAILFGITNLQALIYYKKYPYDWWVYRYSVALLWILDALNVALATHSLYFYLIDMFGNFAGVLEYGVWSFKAQLSVKIFIVIYVQGLYAIRLWKLGRHFHKILPCCVFLAEAASLGAGLFTVYNVCTTQSFSTISNIKTAIYILFATIVVTDIVIASMMSYYLHKSGEATMFSTTASLIFGLMRLVVASGIATSACSLLALISFIVWPKTLIFLGIDFVLPKLYVNSLLAMFNYRREHLEPHQSDAERGGNSFPTFLHIIPHSSEGSSAHVNINIPLTETERFRSLDDKSDHSKGASLAFE